MTTSTDHAASAPAPRGMGFILVTLLLDVMGVGLVVPVLPGLIGATAGLTTVNGHGESDTARLYGWFVAIFALMQFLFAPVLGSLSDQVGRRPVLLLSLAGSAIDYAMLAFAPSLWMLFVGRTIAGITAASTTVANAYIADVSPPDRRAENFGRAAGVLGIGFVVGPLIGGLLGALGPRVPFLAAGTLTLLNLLYGLFVLPESLTPDHRRRFSLRTANPIASLASLLRVRRRGSSLVLLSAIIFLVTMAYQVLVSTWVLSNGYRFAWNPREHGISLAVWGTIAAIVQGALIGTLGRWLGDKRLLLLGLVFSVASYLLYGLATAGWMIYAVMLVTALSGTAEPAAQGLVSNEVGDDEQGALHGALGSLAGIAEVVGPLLATTLFSHFTAPGRARAIPGAAFFGGAALVVAASLLAVRTIFGNSQSVPSNEAKHDSSPST